MRKLCARKSFRVVVGLLSSVCLIVLILCWRYRIWSHTDYLVYQEVLRYPIGEDLWFGRIKAGQDLDAFIADHSPHRSRQMGRYSVLSYYSVWPTPPGSLPMESLSVVAEDGLLVQAGAASCCWRRVFFEMNARSATEFDQAWARYHGR